MRKFIGLVVVGAIMLFNANIGSAAILELQNGFNGYNGAQDTWIEQVKPADDNSESDILHTRTWKNGNTTDNRRTLIYFDLASSGLPVGATINSATLSLYQKNSGYTDNVGKIGAYSVLGGAWVDSSADWVHRSGTSAWSTPGLGTADYDAGSKVLNTLGGNNWHNWDVEDIVSDWWSGTDNFGFYLRIDPYYHADLYSSELLGKGLGGDYKDDPSPFRPKLILDYTPGTPTTPEPATMVLFGISGAAMAFIRKRKKA